MPFLQLSTFISLEEDGLHLFKRWVTDVSYFLLPLESELLSKHENPASYNFIFRSFKTGRCNLFNGNHIKLCVVIYFRNKLIISY